MRIKINEDKNLEELEIQINCKEKNEEVDEVIYLLKSKITKLKGIKDGEISFIHIKDIFYIESVDKRSFLYTKSEVCEIKERLYILAKKLREYGFIRISKNTVVNIMCVSRIKPKINKRLILTLENEEKIIVSRSFVDEFKRELKM